MTWSRRVRFEDWFQKKNFAIKDAIYQSWLTLKRASIVTEAEALDALIAESIPKIWKDLKPKETWDIHLMLPIGIGIQSGIDEVKELEAKETRRKPGNSNVI